MPPRTAAYHARPKGSTRPKSQRPGVVALTAPSAMKLTYDTLLHMISLFSYAREAMPLIATCRVLYHEGAKIALKKSVEILDAGQLASFLKFLRADNSSRCRSLRQLELWGFYTESEVVQELLETIPLLVNIQYLRLVNAEELLECDPAVPTMLAALTSLRHINVSGAKRVTCALLSSLQSPLSSATIDFISDDAVDIWDHLDIDQWPRYHPATLLANFASTLEELECVAWSTTSDTVIPEKVYPNMRKLSIEVHDLPLRMDPFIRAFPHLTNLQVHAGNYRGPICYFDLEVMRASHEANVGQQLTSCGTWTRLEHFTGDLVDLYAIGLTCHISRIVIEDDVEDELRLDMLATVLRYARPLHLKFKGISNSILDNSERSFISTLRSECASTLLNLDLRIYFEEEDQDKDLRVVIDNLVSTLTCLRLKFLQLRFDTDNLDPTPMTKNVFERMMCLRHGLPEPPELTPVPLTPAELSLNSLDMDALMGRLESIPSLEAALVVLPSSRDEGDIVERTITKGTSRLAGEEQWRHWLPSGKNPNPFLQY
ncbi:hypothetical protein LXA43DRAFT_1047765 [Ganoderma leucocontextum]|nr:hypothetical protein LXA43DRAFT_1047765 [Ganoderma leucocontextum]